MKHEASYFFPLTYSRRRTITGCLPSMQKLKILSIDFALKQRLASQTVFMVLYFILLHLKVDVNSVQCSLSYQQACLLSPSALMLTRAIFRLLRLSQHNINSESLL